jgi:hypothetical protein
LLTNIILCVDTGANTIDIINKTNFVICAFVNIHNKYNPDRSCRNEKWTYFQYHVNINMLMIRKIYYIYSVIMDYFIIIYKKIQLYFSVDNEN